MAKQKLVKVHMDRTDEYEIDKRTKRSLPIGWQGRVPQKVAKQFEARGSGRIIPDDAPAEKVNPAQTADNLKGAAKADGTSETDQATTANAGQQTGSETDQSTDTSDDGNGAGGDTPGSDAPDNVGGA